MLFAEWRNCGFEESAPKTAGGWHTQYRTEVVVVPTFLQVFAAIIQTNLTVNSFCEVKV